MKEKFEFKTDTQSLRFCEDIVKLMVVYFGITADEAVGRINRDWRGLELIGTEDVIYHEDEAHWAKTIYYGKSSNWWLNPQNLKPRPYP